MNLGTILRRLTALEGYGYGGGGPPIDPPTDEELLGLALLRHVVRDEPGGISPRERRERWPEVTAEELREVERLVALRKKAP